MKKILLIASCLLLLGCTPKYDEGVIRKDIQILLVKYQKAVNSIDRFGLEEILSNNFQSGKKSRTDYVVNILSSTFLIENITPQQLTPKEYSVLSLIHMTGTQIYHPRLAVPLYKDQLPFITGQITRTSYLAFGYENNLPKILGEEPLITQGVFRWGEAPTITTPSIPERAAPGSTIDLSFTVQKGTSDVAFVYVNETLLGNIGLGSTDSEFTFSYVVPPTGADISIQVFAGTNDLNNINDSLLQGVTVLRYSIPTGEAQ